MVDWRKMVSAVQGRCVRVFGARTQFTFEPYDGGAVLVARPGIFRAPHVELDTLAETPISSAAPTLDVILSDLPNPPRPNVSGQPADHVTIHFQPDSGFQWSGDTRFRIADEQPDGEGMTSLVLEEVLP